MILRVTASTKKSAVHAAIVVVRNKSGNKKVFLLR